MSEVPEVGEIRIGVRISVPGDPLLDSENMVVNELEYVLPEMHLKQPTLVRMRITDPNRRKIGLLPAELQENRFNNVKLWQSQLPPNYVKPKLTIIDEDELQRIRELEEYEKKQAARPRLRLQLKTKKNDIKAAAGELLLRKK